MRADLGDVPGSDEASLRMEVRRLGMWLCGEDPPLPVVDHYVRWHRMNAPVPRDRLDRILVRWGVKGGLRRFWADQYAVRFRRDALLRKKLTLVLALCETVAPMADQLDRPVSRGAVEAFCRLLGRALLSALGTGTAVLLLGPVHLFSSPERPAP